MTSFPWARFGVYSAALVGIGYGLMKATTPSEAQLYNEMAPDLRRKVDAARATRLAREAEMKKQVDAQISVFLLFILPFLHLGYFGQEVLITIASYFCRLSPRSRQRP
ncbi:hypothetical protein BDZ97DRAFT_2073058 [Flammula alnicola]|nr:hypothetical protein BDZ97DRAFT_2073058 [Flammula alnicola]